MPLGYHLRAQQNIGSVLLEFGKKTVKRILFRSAVSIHSQNLLIGQKLGYFLLYLLCSEAGLDQMLGAAGRAFLRNGGLIAAPMTEQKSVIVATATGVIIH